MHLRSINRLFETCLLMLPVHPPIAGVILTTRVDRYRGGSGLVRCKWRLVPDDLPDEWPNNDPDNFPDEVDDEDVGSDGKTNNNNKRFIMKVTIPPNTTAVVTLPDAYMPDDSPGHELGSGAYLFKCAYRDPGRWPPKAVESFNWQDYLDRKKGDCTGDQM